MQNAGLPFSRADRMLKCYSDFAHHGMRHITLCEYVYK